MSKYYRIFILFFALLYTSTSLLAQNSGINPEIEFENENYAKAIKGYKEIVKYNEDDYHAKLMLGKCYLNSNIDNMMAIKYLDEVKDNPATDYEALFLLGQAYHKNYKFDAAILIFKSYVDFADDTIHEKAALRFVENCENAKFFVSNPTNVVLTNLGDTINSKAPDYNVFVEENELFLVFSSKRAKRNKAEGPTPSGYYTSDVFVSWYADGTWQKLKSQSKVSTPANEESVGMSSDGTLLFLNTAGRGVSGDMTVSKRKGKSFKEPVMMEKTVNSKATEMTESVSNDKKKFYYASNRKGGSGGFDIYVAQRLPDLTWASSQEISKEINSSYDELFPQLSPDEKTFYFCSKGHNSMGGYDIFKSKWNEEKQAWGKPINMGYPINTPDDDMHFAINKAGDMGYISTCRKDSRGDLDIYSVKFNNVDIPKSIVVGRVATLTPIDYSDYEDVRVYKKDGKEILIPKKERFKMKDKSWTYDRDDKKKIRTRYKLEGTYEITVDGVAKKIKKSELPKNYTTLPLQNVSLAEVMDVRYKAFVGSKTAKALAPIYAKSKLTVTDIKGDIVGIFVCNPKSGKFVMNLAPGKYEAEIESDGYETVKTAFEVLGKGSFQKQATQHFVLPSNGTEQKANFREIIKLKK